MGHEQRIDTIKDMEKNFSGLRFAGNYLEGISVGDVIKNALATTVQLQKSDRD